jgi:DNA modification methylase
MNLGLTVEYVDTLEIKSYKNNPKIHKGKQIRQIVNSISEFKFNNPILIDENNIIIAGHGRLLAAKHLNMSQVPVIKLLHLSDAQKKTYRIADNKLTENGDWDYDLLKLEFTELEKLDLDFSLDITGFDVADIDIILDESLTDKATKVDETANTVPFISEDEVVSKYGDLWQLGKHRIICGNSLEESTYKLLLGEKKANMIFTDPPYNVKVSGHVCGLGKIKHKEFLMASGEMTENEFQVFLLNSFSLLKEFSTDGSLHYICMDWRHIKEIINTGKEVYDDFKNLCVWNKDNGGMGSLYRSKHELIFIFKNGVNPHRNNIELGSHGRYRTNVWDYPGVNSFDKDKLKFHPTVKPMEMVKDAILDVTNRNEIVLDAFLGSGTTLIAAEDSGRICYGIEMEPLYIDTTIRRWQEMTGISAINLSTGNTYKELSEKLKGGKNE